MKDEYIETVQKIELYTCLQSIIDRVRHFDREEIVKDQGLALAWLSQLEEIKKSAMAADSIKNILLTQSADELMRYAED